MKQKFFFLLFLSLYIVNCTFYIEAQATIRYVSKTGTNTPPYTSWQTAADSIQKCIKICGDGDTIYVANGIYKEDLVINTAISLIGSSMDSTVIDGRGMGDFTVIFNVSGLIENFNIMGKGEDFLTSRVIRSTNQTSLLFMSNCRLSQSGVGVSMVGGDVIAEKIYMTNLGRGFNLFGVNVNRINNCIIILANENSNSINIGFSPNILNYLTNNIILNFADNHVSDEGIYCGLPKKVYIYNNLISGFGVNLYMDGIEDTAFIKLNILTNGGAGILTDRTSIIMNNVISNNNIGIANYSVFNKSDYNIFWKNNHNFSTIIAYGDSDIVADPMFINDTIPVFGGSYDFHLQKYSPAIDKGDPSIIDVDGSRSDIGLFGGPLGESYTYQDLAPKPPRNLTASMDSGLVHLKWNKNSEADLFRYRVYRDTVPDFVYDTTKIIAVISDTTFYDDPPQKFISGNYYYKITAIDSAYHQSPASEEAHINITGIPEAPPIVVEHYNLLQNYPNPFNPSTIIPYRLKAPGYVKVMVYNLLGEQVKVLVNKYQSAGYYEVLFHPTTTERQSAEGKIEFETGYGDIVSGIYLYRIEVIGEGNIPVFTDMKKMLLVK